MSVFENTVKNIRDILLYIVLFISALSYHPFIMRASKMAGYESGTILSRYISLLFVVVLIMSFNWKTVQQSRIVHFLGKWLVVILAFGLIISAFWGNNGLLRELRVFVFVLGSIIIGYDFKINRTKLFLIVFAFSLPALFSGLMQVVINIGGFRIVDFYLADSKNSMGAILASVCFSFIFLSRNQSGLLYKFILVFLAVVSFIIIATIRARMAMFSVFLIMMFYFYLKNRNQYIIVTTILIVIISVFVFLLLPENLTGFFEASLTAGEQGVDITSGRLETYRDAVTYLSDHPFIGNVSGSNQIGWVHNYLLLHLYEYGLLFSWPIFVIYIVFFIRLIKMAINYSPASTVCLGSLSVLVLFLISMAEPTLPFAPGTVTIFNFVLLGIAEKEIVNSDIAPLKEGTIYEITPMFPKDE